MASLSVRVGVGLLERLDSPLVGKRVEHSRPDSPLEPMNSATPSTTSEQEPELLDLSCGPPAVASIHPHEASFSWTPVGKVPPCLTPVYTLELQQLEGVESVPNTNWLSVYKGEAPFCKVDELKSGRRYAVRVVATVEQPFNREESPDHVGVDVRIKNADYVIFSTPSTVPSMIQPPSLAQRARNALKLKWNVPEDPGGVFELTYVLQVSPAPLGCEAQRIHMGGFVEVYRGPERSYKVTKLQPGVRYTSRVQAINPIGGGPFSLCSAYTTQATVPAAPAPPMVQTASATTLTLAWSPPADNGSPIIGYYLERDDGAGGDFMQAYVGPNTCHMVKGLRPGAQYRFRLRADNDEGRSLWSGTTVLSTGAAPPDSPLSLQVVSAGRTSATLAWRAPDEDGGSRVLGFDVELQAKSRAATACMGSDWLKIFDGEAHACTINSLRPGCAYRVRVRARNAAGWGQWALPVDLTTAAEAPEAPLSLQSGVCTSSTMIVTWAPPRHDGGAKVSCYRLEMASGDCHCGRCPQANKAAAAPPPPPPLQQAMLLHGMPPPPPAAGGTDMGSALGSSALVGRPVLCPAHKPLVVYAGETVGAELRQLQPGSRYIFRVQAVNSHGAGPWTDWVLGSTSADVPLTPTPPAVTGVAPSALILSWQAPPGQGAPVTQYTVEAAPLPQVPMMAPPGPAGILADPRVANNLSFKPAYRGAHTGCEVRGLEPYCAYAFRLCAHNEVGASPWSLCAAAITSHAPPTCPQSVSATATSSCKILLCWAPPERDYGSPVASYTVDMAPISRNVANRSGGAGAGGGGGAASWTHLFTGPACSCTAEGLTPGRAYQFRVRAANMCGCGPYAAPVSATTLPAPPSAPGKPSVSARTATGFRVRWDEPEHTYGAHVTAYVLEVAPAGTEDWAVQYTGVEAAAKISGLQPASKYAVRVAAMNSAGQGAFGECEFVITTLLPPQPPSGLTVTEVQEVGPSAGVSGAAAAGEGVAAAAAAASATEGAVASGSAGPSVSVAWQEPSAEGPHAAILGYEVVSTPKPGSDVSGAPAGGVVKLNLTGRRCEARLEGLVPSCSYSVRVRAVGVDGTGHSGWSEEVAVTTPARPDAEVAPASTSSGIGSGAGGAASAGTGQQRKGGAAGRKAAKRQQAAAVAAAAATAVVAASASTAGSVASSEDAVAAANGALLAVVGPSSAPRQRNKAGGAASRVTQALTTATAKKVRQANWLERTVGDSRGAELVVRAIFGPNWRRNYMRSLKFYGKILVVIILLVLAVSFAGPAFLSR